MIKILSSVLRSLAQAAIVLIIALIVGIQLSNLTAIWQIGTFAALFLISLELSSLFVMLPLRSSDWQNQMAITSLLKVPYPCCCLQPIRFFPRNSCLNGYTDYRQNLTNKLSHQYRQAVIARCDRAKQHRV
jgi:ABC-2 type transport system permease protein